jgi:hypothetical protein
LGTIFPFLMPVKEVVVYIVNESALAGFTEASAAMDTFLATRPGFKGRVALPDATIARRYIDLVDWASLEEAQQAMQAAEKEESVVAFMQSIETIEMASHFLQ